MSGIGDSIEEFELYRTSVPTQSEDTIAVLGLIEKSPSFHGGEQALNDFLAKNIHYPQLARDINIQGGVNVQFVWRRTSP